MREANMSHPFIIRMFDKYYAMDAGTQFIETYSLHQATEFPSKEAATQWINDFTDYAEFSEVIEKTPELVDAYDKWAETMVRRVFDKVDKTGKDDYNPKTHTKIDILNFHLYEKWNSKISRDSARTWPNLFFSEFVALKSVGNANEPGNLSAEISVKHDANVDDVIDELKFFMNHIGVTEQTFGVFDFYLCEHGNKVSLSLYPEDEAEISGRMSLEGTWSQCIQYLINHRYYPPKYDE